ncbi:unnamed protein product [Caenorhabditis sp. 36 PRJEB53466]|nr:unnamed protein product [Caenorhabditis sp. 36 PRJEB53466]
MSAHVSAENAKNKFQAQEIVTMSGSKKIEDSVLPGWVTLWLLISGLVCTYDVAYTMNRPFTNDPASAKAGFLFGGWALYSSVDRHYLTTNDILTCSTGRVMLLECMLNFIAIGLAIARSRHGLLLAFTSNVMVLWKTILFFSIFLGQPEGHLPPMNPNKFIWSKFMIFWIPNGVWVIMPTLVLFAIWNKLALPPKISEKYWEASNRCRGDLDFEDKRKICVD